ncbi:monofunctional biosynthetic peptidoglycan transglycosylase [Sphingomonas lutea]|uniref:Biosynthetic peptidoglycan transglycosylase n=1 Tax=Sphingomonas lutea TaxID=1045317 RepID=A0A7G9SFQ2_9SPHN|nr:monofunctional biosynthetic peptidoglycan transglycosylase [Sphingomonas lutea]
MAARTGPSIPRYKRKRQRSLPRRLFGWLVKLILIFLIGSVIWVLAYRFIPPPITVTMIGDALAGRGVEKDWMSINQIDRDMVRAAIAAEDSKFCQHNGFDWDSIAEAARRNASGGRIRGGSTISQQTAKNAFLWQGGGYARKGLEAWFTFLIENLWGKRRIMEVYLNLAETGIGTYGVNAGSQRYFGHDASAMSATEAARIAAVLPLPKKRGAVAPKGFTRRYGSTIAARIGVVARDGLDGCVYRGTTAPANRTAPSVTKSSRPLPGDEYESTNPPPPVDDIDTSAPPAATEPVIEDTPLPTPDNAVEPAIESEPPPVPEEETANRL